LGDFDSAMIHLLGSTRDFQDSEVVEIWHNDADQVLAFQRKSLIFVFNFNPTQSFTDYGFLVGLGDYEIVLDTDAKEYGGFGLNDDSLTHFTNHDPLYSRYRKGWLKLYLPARSALVLRKKRKNNSKD
jgi:1,4-alpha-glucan branching enzyme